MTTDWFDNVPKVELHLHLEGAIPRPALWELMQKYGGDASVPNFADLDKKFTYANFPEFIQRWIWKNQFLREYEDFTFFSEAFARELVSQLKADTPKKHWNQEEVLRTRLTRLVETSLRVCGPVKITPGGRRVVALIGPTGVGKTTTIAKLAANHRLREKQRVGLITVDTYRIAAVEQLRTYADIIDLPMKVVATPSEMREAMRDFDQMELVLIDTAGRSPRDDGKLQELRDFLAEAQADEVHLVLSAVGSRGSLIRAAERFKTVGATSLIMTKLDEAASLGVLLPLVQASQLPLSYVTNGQSVPDDIAIAESGRLANSILHVELVAG